MLPLEGIKVLDLSRLIPGPFCTMLLSDMGADVLKIEEIDSQSLFSLAKKAEGERQKAACYDALNRNKKSIMLNLKAEEAQNVFYRLAKEVDIIVEEFRPGVTKRLGVDYETIKQINPGIIYCAITCYGQDGPYAKFPGHDPNCCSIAGALAYTTDQDGEPVPFGIPLADVSSALHAVIGILLALRAREKTERGQFIDISMTDSALSFMVLASTRYFTDGRMPAKIKVMPMVLKTKEGKFITVANAEPHFWERFCRAIGREDFIPLRHAKGEKLREMASTIEQIFLDKTRDEWVQILREADTCVAPVLDINEVFNDPQVLHRQMCVELEHPTIGKVKQQGVSIKLSDTPGRIGNFAPLPGEHTEAIISNLGYTKDEIERLKKIGAIK